MNRLLHVLAIAAALAALTGPGQAQADPSTEAKKAWTGVYLDRVELIEQAVAAGAELATIQHDGKNLVTMAATRGSPAMLTYLAAQGVNIDLKDGKGYTPVMRALEQGRVDNALKLRDLGASLEGVTDDGYTVRVLAEVAGLNDFGPEPPGREVLLSREAASDILLKAVEFGDVESVKLALDNGADVSAKTPTGWTPVMVAALAGHADIVSLLAEKGVFGSRDTPLDTVGDRVDAVVLALLGKGSGGPDAIDRVLAAILRHKDVSAGNDYYRTLAARQGYGADFVDRHFPPGDLPPPEYILPRVVSNDRDSWKRVQATLQDLGLYRGEVDGVPDMGTLTALHGYVAALEEPVLRRAVTAMTRAQNLRTTAGGSSNQGYSTFEWNGEEWSGQTRRTARAVPGGYFGRWIDPSDPGNADIVYGYFEPDMSTKLPLLMGSQFLRSDGELSRRSWRLRLAGGVFETTRDAAFTRFSFIPDEGGETIAFDLEENNSPLPAEPFPDADLMDRSPAAVGTVTAAVKSVIIGSSAVEPDQLPTGDPGMPQVERPLSAIEQLEEALEK